MGCDSNGKLTLTNPRTGPAFIIEDGKNLMGITYSRSIEDTKTQAKVIGGPKGKETVVLVKTTLNVPNTACCRRLRRWMKRLHHRR